MDESENVAVPRPFGHDRLSSEIQTTIGAVSSLKLARVGKKSRKERCALLLSE